MSARILLDLPGTILCNSAERKQCAQVDLPASLLENWIRVYMAKVDTVLIKSSNIAYMAQ